MANGLRRVVFVAPYTSIIEQTAAVFRGVLGDADVLEHHASFDWEATRRASDDADDAAANPVARLRRAADTWDAPVIVTTAVQFFESLFAARRNRCRKLHNLAGAVIVLDEAQTLPLPLLQPCLAALDELARNYGASLVLCTATQPAIRAQDGFKGGLDIPASRELAPDPAALYDRLRRVRVDHLAEPVDEAALVAAFAGSPQMLCIVNRRDHAAALFGRIRAMDGAVHLSTLMVPRHRRAVLKRVRARLEGPVAGAAGRHLPDGSRRGRRLPGGMAGDRRAGPDCPGGGAVQPGGPSQCRPRGGCSPGRSSRHRVSCGSR